MSLVIAKPTGSRLVMPKTSYPDIRNGIVTSGLVLNLDAAQTASYPGTGTTWTDLSGNGNNGTLVNGPTYSSANYGSIVFDGSNDYVGTSGIGSPSFTISAWIKLSELNRFQGIMGRADSIFSNLSYAFRVLIDNKLNIALSNSGNSDSNYQELTSAASLAVNTWYYVAITFSRPDVKLFINGSVEATSTFNFDLFNSTANSIIGGYTYGNGLGFLLKGAVSSIQFYNRALTAAEVQQNFNCLRMRYGL